MAPSVSDAAAKVADVASSTKSSAKEIKKEKTAARMLGAGMYTWTGQWMMHHMLTLVGCAGIAELMVFHPVDTTAKRLMSNYGKVHTQAYLHPILH